MGESKSSKGIEDIAKEVDDENIDLTSRKSASKDLGKKEGSLENESTQSTLTGKSSKSGARKGEIQFMGTAASEELKKKVADAYNKSKSLPSLPKVVEGMKKILDSDAEYSKGWVVIAGMHVTCACSFVQLTIVEFIVDDTAFVAFQTFCPKFSTYAQTAGQ